MAAHLLSDTARYRWVQTICFDSRDADGHPLWRWSGEEVLFDEHGQVFDQGRSGAKISRRATTFPAELPAWCRKPETGE